MMWGGTFTGTRSVSLLTMHSAFEGLLRKWLV